jgi:hypothetical protein
MLAAAFSLPEVHLTGDRHPGAMGALGSSTSATNFSLGFLWPGLFLQMMTYRTIIVCLTVLLVAVLALAIVAEKKRL